MSYILHKLCKLQCDPSVQPAATNCSANPNKSGYAYSTCNKQHKYLENSPIDGLQYAELSKH